MVNKVQSDTGYKVIHDTIMWLIRAGRYTEGTDSILFKRVAFTKEGQGIWKAMAPLADDVRQRIVAEGMRLGFWHEQSGSKTHGWVHTNGKPQPRHFHRVVGDVKDYPCGEIPLGPPAPCNLTDGIDTQ